ncbi:MAG TPA: glycosyl hydrolase family 79 C-terminal domain-containing protein [Solirubrobacteraceae bacterium]|nr:glycosyl hydrolase family 79 C-terminal domain-containing protein [Solirubrobacteraceae bacterium]
MRLRLRWWRLLRKSLMASVVVLVCIGGGLAYALSRSSSSTRSGSYTGTVSGATVANISSASSGTIPSGYLGLSFEIRGIESYTGTDAHAINPVFEQLIRNLAPGQRPVLRIGGDSTDETWYPYRKGAHPVGVRFTLPSSWFSTVRALVQGVDGRLILGVNLEQDSTAVASSEARAFESKIGSQYIEALALGNEPELYHGLAWYSIHGVKYYGRPAGWDFSEYLSNYNQILRSMPKTVLAGPDEGGPAWIPELGTYLASEPRVKILTIHRYPLKECTPSEHATIAQLLSSSSTRGYAAGLAGVVATARRHGVTFRLDEMNSVSCGGENGVSDTFASSLWALDAMFELAHAGVGGVNVHTRAVPNQLFTFTQSHGQWAGDVKPDYYGLLAFAQAAPPGSSLLKVSGFGSGQIHIYATRAPDGTEHVVLINMASKGSERIDVKIGSSATAGTLERLTAPSLAATGHVSLGGQSFAANTSTGQLTGTPSTTTVSRGKDGGYSVPLPAASAAILTLPAS